MFAHRHRQPLGRESTGRDRVRHHEGHALPEDVEELLVPPDPRGLHARDGDARLEQPPVRVFTPDVSRALLRE